jgi:hypothetical protein
MDKAVCDFKSWPGGKFGIGKGSPPGLGEFDSVVETRLHNAYNKVYVSPSLLTFQPAARRRVAMLVHGRAPVLKEIRAGQDMLGELGPMGLPENTLGER